MAIKYSNRAMMSEAQKIAKLKATEMFQVEFEMWGDTTFDNVSGMVFTYTMKEAHQRMFERTNLFFDSGDYKVIKVTKTNEYDLCNS